MTPTASSWRWSLKPQDDRGTPWPDGPVDAEHAIRGFHSVTMTLAEMAASFNLLTTVMGFRVAGQEGKTTRFETGAGGPHAILDVIESPEGPEGEESIGTVHHVAWRTPDPDSQIGWRDALLTAGRNVTPVIDRWYFKSIYFREPGGVLFEIATDGPGFTVDEAPESLGTRTESAALVPGAARQAGRDPTAHRRADHGDDRRPLDIGGPQDETSGRGS